MGYQKNILVRMKDAESEHNAVIKAYYTADYSETLKMFQYMQKEGIPIKVPDDGDFGSKYDNELLFITDIEVGFGSNISLTYIDIYVSDAPE